MDSERFARPDVQANGTSVTPHEISRAANVKAVFNAPSGGSKDDLRTATAIETHNEQYGIHTHIRKALDAEVSPAGDAGSEDDENCVEMPQGFETRDPLSSVGLPQSFPQQTCIREEETGKVWVSDGLRGARVKQGLDTPEVLTLAKMINLSDQVVTSLDAGLLGRKLESGSGTEKYPICLEKSR